MEQHILVKGMVCDRCVDFIQRGFRELGLPVIDINLGKVSFSDSLSDVQRVRVVNFLINSGFEPMSSRHERLVGQVKHLVEEYLSQAPLRKAHQRFSDFISESLNLNYDSISEIFSNNEGLTLEKYVIDRRLEKVKEFLVYTDKSLTEISHELGYSSINHLSRQFKEIIGFTPSHYRQIKGEKTKVILYNHEIV